MLKLSMESYAMEYFEKKRKYKKQISEFIDFLKSPEINKVTQVARISEDDVDIFIGYSKQIKSIDTMFSYLEGIKSFDDFLMAQGYRATYIIPRGEAYSDFKRALSTKYSLKERVERDCLEGEEIQSILDSMDRYFETETYPTVGKEKKERYIYWLCLRIYVKLCLLVPAKKSVLIALKFDDFDEAFRTVKVNGISMKIPNGLRYNIMTSLRIVEEETKVSWTKSEGIFDYFTMAVKVKSENIDTALNQKFCLFLREHNLLSLPPHKTSFSLEVLSNSTIYQMIESGTNPYFISQLTGISIGQLDSKYYSKIPEISYTMTATSELNKSVACSDYYQYL